MFCSQRESSTSDHFQELDMAFVSFALTLPVITTQLSPRPFTLFSVPCRYQSIQKWQTTPPKETRLAKTFKPIQTHRGKIIFLDLNFFYSQMLLLDVCFKKMSYKDQQAHPSIKALPPAILWKFRLKYRGRHATTHGTQKTVRAAWMKRLAKAENSWEHLRKSSTSSFYAHSKRTSAIPLPPPCLWKCLLNIAFIFGLKTLSKCKPSPC